MAARVTMTGSGSIGEVRPGWSVTDEATPVSIGDSAGSVGSAMLAAERLEASEFVADNTFEIAHESLGTFVGRVSSVDVAGIEASLSVAGYPEFLNATVTAPPQVEFELGQSAFGSAGSADGQFSLPSGAAVDPLGNVYVVDRINNRIQKFTSGGVFISKWGTFGTGDGQFSAAVAVAADRNGYVYVADGTRVQKFTYAGTFDSKWGTAGTGNGQFTALTAITCDAVGNVYTADMGNIQRFTSAGTFVTRWYPTVEAVVFTEDFENSVRAASWISLDGGTVSVSTAQAQSPTHSLLLKAAAGAVTAIGEVPGIEVGETYRATASGRAEGATVNVSTQLLWDSGSGFGAPVTSAGWTTAGGSTSVASTDVGVLVLKVTTVGGQGAYFDDVTVTREARPIVSLATDESGNVYALDSRGVTQYTSTGSQLAQWGSIGTGNGQFTEPGGIAVDTTGVVLVTDSNRVQTFTSAGEFITTWGDTGTGTSDYEFPGNLAVSSSGIIYVADRSNNRVRVTDPTGGAARGVLLSEVFQHYVDLADIGHPVTYSASSNPRVIYQGWRDKCWVKIKELASANGVAFRAVGTTLEVVDATGPILDISNATVPRITPRSAAGARAISVVYQNTSGGGNIEMFRATSIFTFPMLTTNRVVLQTASHPVSVYSPAPTDTIPAPAGSYCVVDSVGAQVPAATWLLYGGSVTATVGEYPGQIVLTFRMPTALIPGFTGPYSFASGADSSKLPQLSVTGSGVTTSPETLELLTGAGPSAQDIGSTINNPFITTELLAYERGGWAASDATGIGVDLAFEMWVSDLAGFGLDKGSLIVYNDNQFRITKVVYGNVRAAITATNHVTIGDVTALYSGWTNGEMADWWAGFSNGDTIVKPFMPPLP